MKKKMKVLSTVLVVSIFMSVCAFIKPAAAGSADIPAGIRFNDADVYDAAFVEENRMDSLPTNELDNLPPMVDLSQSLYFPPIGNQGSLGSCAAFATTYYQYTYEKNKLQNTVATTSANWASPKFTYNFMNGGIDGGLITTDVYPFLQEFGAPSWEDFPYVGNRNSVDNYTQWPSEASIYRKAAAVTASCKTTTIGSQDDTTLVTGAWDSDLDQVKGLLNNGKVLVVRTSYHWLTKNVRNSNEIIAYATQGTGNGHAMTVVGYNDTISCDVNGNGIIEMGEQGAFKVANSWGTDYANNGYIWVLYDALNQVSSIPNNTVSNRRAIFSGNDGIERYQNAFYLMNAEEDHSCVFYEVTFNNQTKNRIELASEIMKQDSQWVSSWFQDAGYNNSEGRGGTHRFTGTIAIKRPFTSYTNLDEYAYVKLKDIKPSATERLRLEEVKITDEYGGVLCKNTTPLEITNTSGSYRSMTMPVIKPGSGDINYDGKISVVDANMALRYSTKLIPLSELQLLIADVNGDGKVTSVDANIILNWSVGN